MKSAALDQRNFLIDGLLASGGLIENLPEGGYLAPLIAVLPPGNGGGAYLF